MSSEANTLAFNRYAVWAIYKFEMARALRTLLQSVVTPVITTSLYFVVFGAAIGSRMTEADPMTTGRLCRSTASSAHALTMISGPTPAGSPIVTPSTGRLTARACL